jgi:ectoine hydroxylase-related dioxygenase (phytanoyl-CoA dioxygenase family)
MRLPVGIVEGCMGRVESLFQLDDQALDAYARDGFIAVSDLISQQEVIRLRAILSDLHHNRTGYERGQLFDAVGLDDGREERFPQIIDPRLLAPALLNSEYYRVGLQIARQILGRTARIRNDISFFKPAKIGSDTPWHQDEAFGNPIYEYRQLTIWLALTPAPAESSCLSFIPGSHKRPVLLHQPVGGDPRIHALECIGPFDASQAVRCPLTPGSCTIHDHRTLHYAGPNVSQDDRMAYALVFDARPTFRAVPLDFPWRKTASHTARAERENEWRRRQGFFSYLWYGRHHLRLERGMTDVRVMARAVTKSLQRYRKVGPPGSSGGTADGDDVSGLSGPR